MMLGIIGGSGLYEMEALTDRRWKRVQSSFGTPSDEFLFGRLNGLKVVFLPRHGRGHRLPPGDINYRANIDSLKRAGVTDIVSLSACGSFREHLVPGTFILIDQFVDRTRQRPQSFFGPGMAAHVSLAHPTCDCLGGYVRRSAEAAGITLVDGGTYLAIEGPQFSTLAESRLYRSWGADVIGMTNMPEARLAREAEIRYATVAMVTDYDCWREEAPEVQVVDVLAILEENAERAQNLVAEVARLMARPQDQPWENCERACHRALDHAVITPPDARDPSLCVKLDAVAGRILRSVGHEDRG